jgi:hypothetical protein
VGHEVGNAFRHLEVTLERLLAPGVNEINLRRGGFSIEAYKGENAWCFGEVGLAWAKAFSRLFFGVVP